MSRRNRAAGALLDQAASSLQNFTVLFAAMRWLDLDALGVFSLLYALATLAITVTRSLILEPFLVRFSGDEQSTPMAARAAGASLLVGVALALVAATAALVGPDSFAPGLWALSILLPVILVQDAYRYALFAQGRQLAAGVNDSVGLVISVAVLIAVAMSQGRGTPHVFAAWGAGCLVGITVGVRQTGVVPSPRSGRHWLRDHGDLGWPLAGATGAQQGTGRVSQMLITGLGGTAALGAIGASRTLLTPMTSLLTASMSYSVPEAVASLKEGPQHLDRFVRWTSAGLSAILVAYCAALLLVPSSWGEKVVGANWASAISLVLPTGLWVLGMTASQGPRVGLRVLGRARETLRVSVAIGVLLLIGAVVGVLAGGATGAAWGFGAVSLVGQALWWTAYRAARRVGVER